MQPKIKKADIQDISELNKISFESKKYWGYPLEWMEKWRDDLSLAEKDFFHQSIYKLEEECGSIVGFCSIKENEKEYEVVHLWIKPDFIGKGFGKYLLNESVKRVAVKEKLIIVEADPHAENFYSKQGFQTFDKRQSYPEDRLLPLMKRILPPMSRRADEFLGEVGCKKSDSLS